MKKIEKKINHSKEINLFLIQLRYCLMTINLFPIYHFVPKKRKKFTTLDNLWIFHTYTHIDQHSRLISKQTLQLDNKNTISVTIEIIDSEYYIQGRSTFANNVVVVFVVVIVIVLLKDI